MFVSIFVEPPNMDDVVAALRKIPNVECVYEVSGEFDVVALVEVASIQEFRDVLKDRILKIQGIKSTVSDVVLKAYPRSD